MPEQALPWLDGAMMVVVVLPLAGPGADRLGRQRAREHARWRWWRRLHFWFSVIYTVTNLPHLIADIVVPDGRADQIALMAVLVGVQINREGWLWWRQAGGAAGSSAAGPES